MEAITNEVLIELVSKVNDNLRGHLEKKYTELGLDPNKYANGLRLIPVSSSSTIEDNIKNILSIFVNNYSEGVFFQTQSSAKDIEDEKIYRFIKKKGLSNEFRQYMDVKSESIIINQINKD